MLNLPFTLLCKQNALSNGRFPTADSLRWLALIAMLAISSFELTVGLRRLQSRGCNQSAAGRTS